MSYRNEAAFSRALIERLNKEGTDCVRLESHSTEVGIPDVFIQGHGHDCFLELKNKEIIYRPGQEAWHKRYYVKHARRKSVLTLCARDSGIYFTSQFDNEVRKINASNLSRFLFIASTRISYAETNRIALVHWVNKFWPQFDWDPDVIECVSGHLDEPFDSRYMNSIKYQLYEELDCLFTAEL